MSKYGATFSRQDDKVEMVARNLIKERVFASENQATELTLAPTTSSAVAMAVEKFQEDLQKEVAKCCEWINRNVLVENVLGRCTDK